MPTSIRWIDEGLGRQAITNAIRFLSRKCTEEPPERPPADQLQHPDDIEAAMEKLLRNVRGLCEQAGEKVADAAQRLKPSHHKAYQQYSYALVSAPQLATDREAYDWLTEHLDDGDHLPAFSTWTRYLREARSVLGTQKHESRRGREHGGSIVREDQT